MKRFTKTGVIEHLNHKQPQYGFVTGEDFRESLETIQKARESFAELPADLRQDFDNDPSKFLDFVHNPENMAEMAEMGLLSPEATETHLRANQNRENGSKGLFEASNGLQIADGVPSEPEGGAGTVTT